MDHGVMNTREILVGRISCFNYSGKLIKPQIGDLLKVRFSGAGQDGFYKVLSLEKADANYTSDALRNFQGNIKINENGKFGFVEDVFIEPNIISKMNLQNQQKISGIALLSFNKKKERGSHSHEKLTALLWLRPFFWIIFKGRVHASAKVKVSASIIKISSL